MKLSFYPTHFLKRFLDKKILVIYGPYLGIVGLNCFLFWPLLLGRMPISHDHPVHLFKAWHFVEKMLTSFRISGWSEYWFAGWPAGELYPPGTDIWIALFRLPTFFLSWEKTYAFAFLSMFILSSLAIYWLGSYAIGRLAGFVAACLYLLDPGAWREGGWNYVVNWGVWPQALSNTFAFLAFLMLERLKRKESLKDLILLGVMISSSLISHPINLIFLSTAFIIWFLVQFLLREKIPTLKILQGITIGILLAGFWYVPFIAKTEWAQVYGAPWRSLPQIGYMILSGTLFRGMSPFLFFLGFFGIILGLFQRRPFVLFLSLLSFVLIFIASSSTYDILNYLGLDKVSSRILFHRFLIPLKICFFLSCGWMVFRFSLIFNSPKPSTSKLKNLGVFLFSLLVLAPFLGSIISEFSKRYMKGVGIILTSKDIGKKWEDYQRFLNWSKDLKKKEPNFFRIAYKVYRHDHSFISAPVTNNIPFYKPNGFTPASNFIHKITSFHPEVLKALNVKYIVSKRPLMLSRIDLIKRFGHIRVFKFMDWHPSRYTIKGPGKAKVKLWEDEKIRIKIWGADSKKSKLKLHVAHYVNWRAYMNGKEVKISPAYIYNDKFLAFMEVPIQDGIIEFRFTRLWMDILGRLFTCIGIAMCIRLKLNKRLRKGRGEKLRLE
jgi:hypothetical protein